MRHFRLALVSLLALFVGAGGFVLATSAQAVTCDRNATPATLASEVAAATTGQVICLATGNYGTWAGTGKAVTLRAADGASPSMRINFGSGDAGFTLDGMTGMGGSITPGAHDFTIRGSTFNAILDLRGSPGANIVLDGNTHDWPVVSTGGANAKIFVWSSSPGASSGATIKNSHIANGGLDGIHIGGSAGVNVLDNVFSELCGDSGPNHTDMLQTEGMVGGRIAGNLFQGSASCGTQALTSYDSGTVGVVLEDNVIDVRRPWGIEWYSDRDSIVRHNTVRWYPDSQCDFNGIQCGQIDINRKSQDPAGSGTQVYDNVAIVDFANGSTGTAHHNVSGQTAVFAGPLTAWAGFQLSPSSPVGNNASSDAPPIDIGIRVTGVPPTPTPTATPTPTPTATPTATPTSTPTPSPSPSPTPTATPTPTPTPTPTATPTPPPNVPAVAAWTAPTGARVGQPVSLTSTSTGDAPLSCAWQFEDADGSTVQTRPGCSIQFTFQGIGTKYVTLIVRDQNGDMSARRRTFTVAA